MTPARRFPAGPRRRGPAAILLVAGLAFAGCGGEDAPAPAPPPVVAPAPVPPRGVDGSNEAAVLARMNRGIAHLERYDYGSATEELRAAVALAPGFYPAQLNLGIALLNLQKEPAATEAALRAAAALEPKEAPPRFLLGMHLAHGVSPPRAAEALREFAAAAERAPDDPDAHLRRGMLLREARDDVAAEEAFTRALDLAPHLGAALNQRGLLRRALGREEEGLADLRRFGEMKKADAVDQREVAYGHMGRLADALKDLSRWLPPPKPVEGAAVRFEPVRDALDDDRLADGRVAVADLDGDGVLDLVVSGGAPVRVAGWRRGLGGWKFGPLAPFAAGDGGTPPGDVAVGDLDGDGALDVVVDRRGVVLGAGGAAPRFVPLAAAGGRGRPLIADLDADGDLDLVMDGTLLLNDARAGFTAAGDLLAEDFVPLFLADVDDDGFPDLVGEHSFRRNLRAGAFAGPRVHPREERDRIRALVASRLLCTADLDGDGFPDRVTGGGDGVAAVRTVPPGGGMEHGWPVPDAQGLVRGGVAADFDGDCDLDLLILQGDRLRFVANTGNAGPRMLHLRLRGVRNENGRQFGWTNARAVGARVEVLVGRRRTADRMGLDAGWALRPAPDVLPFGLGPEGKADLVSIRWTEGVIQGEPDLPACPPGGSTVEQVQRKAASCPVIFTWDGERFAFVADCMGGGGLGFLVAPGVYGPPDPTERVRIDPALLRPRDGTYDVRLAEPLEEIVFADRIALTAIDHPADMAAVPDERFGGAGPPPGDRVYVHRTADRVFPLAATDGRGRDVLDALARTDRVYADGFELHRDLLGFTAADHFVEFEFGDRIPVPRAGDRLVLFLDGWIEYGYSRTFYAAAGAAVAPLSPTLEVPDGAGGWRTLVSDIGYPAGTPRTMTVDVTGVLGPATGRFRIRTNLEIYWDRVYLATDGGEGGVVRTTVGPAEATLRFVGFPREVSPDGRLPKINDYARMDPGMPGFKTMAGEYTRYGDVLPLVLAADDRYVIFRNGEEIALRFPVAAFPPLKEGWTRTFLLETEGWCKDMDPYTATPETVGPLPHRGMSAFPPPPGEEYPTDARSDWRDRWNTRRIPAGR